MPVVGCLTVAAGILARSEEVSKGTGTDQRFVKNALKNAELPPDSFKYLFFFYFCHIHERLKIYLLFPHTGVIVNIWMVFSKEIIPANQHNIEHHPQESR